MDWIGYNQRLKTAEEKFLEKVEKTETCWLWMGGRQPKGYGVFRWYDSAGKTEYLAHRFSYDFYVGPIPTDLMVDHTCQNKSCVNPAHLRLVDALTNIYENSNHVATLPTCKNGHPKTPENRRPRADRGFACIPCERARWLRRKEAQR